MIKEPKKRNNNKNIKVYELREVDHMLLVLKLSV
jgi:hypothetical protein